MPPNWKIPEPNSDKSRIPAPHIPAENIEHRSIVFKFKNYNHGCCEISQLQKPEVKQFVKTLGEINSFRTDNFLTSGRVTPITCAGNYKPLFNNLEPDIRLIEIDYTATGRIFGFLAGNIFNVVAVRKKHIKY